MDCISWQKWCRYPEEALLGPCDGIACLKRLNSVFKLVHTFPIVIFLKLSGFSLGEQRWSVVAVRHWGSPEGLGRARCCSCGACLLRSVWQKRRPQISGQSSLCSIGQFSTTLSKLVTTDYSFHVLISCMKLHSGIEAKIQELEG